jgi:CPA2 family monovalent cation:H+ antiporter-2
MVPEFLKTLVIIFGVSAAVVYVLHKLRVPSVVGFLIAGVFLGPHGFGFVQDINEVELLAEVGVILLLFTVGLEISLKNLKRIRSAVLGGGLLQVLLTFLTTSTIAYLLLR